MIVNDEIEEFVDFTRLLSWQVLKAEDVGHAHRAVHLAQAVGVYVASSRHKQQSAEEHSFALPPRNRKSNTPYRQQFSV
jgi:hypothetical protein